MAIASILGIGLATPRGAIDQLAASRIAARLAGLDDAGRDRLATMYQRTGIERRGSVLMDPGGTGRVEFYDTPLPPTTGDRLRKFEQCAGPLACLAALGALTSSGVLADSITHIVSVSCTGAGAPGFDLDIVEGLGLRRSILRTHVGFMGCHGAINALRIASAVAANEPGASVLVACAELCSLHFNGSPRPDAMIANALFADGAAACIVRGTAFSTKGEPGPFARVLASASLVLPGTRGDMSWRIGDHGFEMTLSPRVPGIIRENLRGWLGEQLAASGLTVGDIRGWCVHPGGPRVLDSVAEALGLGDDAMDVSRDVLREHGNMSSPTVLFILKRLLERPNSAALPAVMLAFGPGLTIELVLIG